MLLGPFIISHHAYEQYDERVTNKTKKTVGKSIRYDLRTLNIRHIIRRTENNENFIHVFTRNNREFIFVEGQKGLVLKTCIRRNHRDTQKKLQRRKALATV